jgi:MFS family permease
MVRTYPDALRSLSPSVRLYLASTALMSFTIYGGIYATLLNLYLLRLGYGPDFIGWVHALAALGYAIFCLLAGALGGRYGTRPMLILGLSLMVVAYGLLPLGEFLPAAVQPSWLVTTNLLGYLGIASYFVNGPPFLMSATNESQRNHAFSLRIALDPIAFSAGGLAGGFLPGVFARAMGAAPIGPAPYRASLLLAVLLLVPGVFALLHTRSSRAERVERLRVTARGATPYGLIAFVALVVLLRYAGRATVKTFFNVYLDDGLHLGPAQIGTLSAAGQALSIPAVLAAPSLMARWGKERTLVLSLLGMALAQLPLALLPHWTAAGISFMVITALFSITTVTIRIYSQEVVAPPHRSAMSSGSMMAEGLIGFGMALGGGYAIVALGYPAIFLTSAGLTAAGGLVFWSCFRVPRGELARARAPMDRGSLVGGALGDRSGSSRARRLPGG